MMKRTVGCLLIIVVAVTAQAEVSFAPVFNDHAVLQCEMPVNVWGSADAGSSVEIRLDGEKTVVAVADVSGTWSAVLPAQPPGGKHTVEAVSGNGTARMSDVWFGEVWLASGQSNMVMPLRNSIGGDERLTKTLPEVRFIKVPQTTGLPVEKEFTAADLAWRIFAPRANQEIAAVAFYFAEQIQQETGRYVGIIQSSYGGTPCEAWTPEWALDEKPELKYLADKTRAALAAGKTKEYWLNEAEALPRYKQALAKWNKTKEGPRPEEPDPAVPGNPWSSKAPAVLFENMIKPIIPYTARGVIWYQGEANAGKPDEYRILFPAMIESWRKLWGRPDWPFLFVQLAAYKHPSQDWSGLRAAQAFTRDAVPHTGMALAIDSGEKENIHPLAKQPVGGRLARLALSGVYGQKVLSRGPAFHSLEIKDGKVTVSFQYSEGGLKTSDGKVEVPGFEMAGANGKFCPAQARIVAKDSIEITCADIPAPVRVRYAWQSWMEPPVTLENSAGLPAEPFDYSSMK